MTAEEQAVIAAAERETSEAWSGTCETHLHPASLAVVRAVRRLRESRAPKPRYTIGRGEDGWWGIYDRHRASATDCAPRVGRIYDLEDAERIAKLLNEAEP